LFLLYLLYSLRLLPYFSLVIIITQIYVADACPINVQISGSI